MNNIKIKLKTSELTGAALDWAVAKCEGRRTQLLHRHCSCSAPRLIDPYIWAGIELLNRLGFSWADH
jgi:hypothetical protein